MMPFDLVARNVGRALEVHVLDPVRDARQARHASFFEPTRYQHHTDASGAVRTSWISTRSPLSSTSS